MPAETIALLVVYFLCSQDAEIRVLERSEMEDCMTLYQQVKLSFVPEVGLAEYQEMDSLARASVNSQGYAAYISWRSENPVFVEQLESLAR